MTVSCLPCIWMARGMGGNEGRKKRRYRGERGVEERGEEAEKKIIKRAGGREEGKEGGRKARSIVD